MIAISEQEQKFVNLKCPECGEVPSIIRAENNLLVVVFKCMFSATFNVDITPEEAQKRLDEFKTSGNMQKWLEGGLF
jgi:uncharacterized Zn finger protein